MYNTYFIIAIITYVLNISVSPLNLKTDIIRSPNFVNYGGCLNNEGRIIEMINIVYF